MTKADIVSNISKNLGIEKVDVQLTVESLMKEIINSLENGENVYLRGFGSFIVKKRAEKLNVKCFQGINSKEEFILNYLDNRFGESDLSRKGLIYIGNDINDLKDNLKCLKYSK